jgi:tetratricopeptide (TPR) repeat protein
MRTMLLRGSAFIVLLLAMYVPASAQTIVTGRVLDEKNQPVDGAVIVFEAASGTTKREVKSDRRGEFLFQGLASGDYTVTASKGELSDTHKTSVSQSAKARIEFILRPKTGTTTAKVPVGPPVLEGLSAGMVPGAKDEKEIQAVQALAASALEAVKTSNHEQAVARLNEIVARVPACGNCFTHLGVSLSELKKTDEAEAALKKGVEITPSVEGYTALTRFYNTQKKFDLAAEASQKASEAGGGGGAAGSTSASSETLYNQGVVLWNAQKYAEAKEQFEAAVKANPGNAAAQYQLGMANLNLGQIPAARTAFEAYLKAEPDGSRSAEVKGYLSQLPK